MRILQQEVIYRQFFYTGHGCSDVRQRISIRETHCTLQWITLSTFRATGPWRLFEFAQLCQTTLNEVKLVAQLCQTTLNEVKLVLFFLQNNTFIANQKKFWELIDSWHKDCQKASSLSSQNKQVSLYTLFLPLVSDVCPVRCHVQTSTLMRFMLLMVDITKCPLTLILTKTYSLRKQQTFRYGTAVFPAK